MLKKISFTLFISLFCASLAQAKILFTPSITYMSQEQEISPAPAVDTKLTIIDLRLGYVFDFGLYVGGLYSIQDHDLLSDSSDSLLGPTLGYYNAGFLVAGTFYVYGEKDITNGSGKYSGVSGYQIDVSYAVPVTENFRMGPQLTYHSYEYSDLEVNGISGSADLKFSSITPYFNLTFVF